MSGARAGAAGLALAVALAGAPGARAQGFRITGSSVAELVQLQPLIPDSIPVASAGDTVPGSAGDLRVGPGGAIVRCVQGATFCQFRRSAATILGVPMVQDIEASGWGFMQGLRAYVHVRARASTGDASVFWPGADDNFDFVAGYLELDRGALRARAGRQWHSSGLGYYDFDGAALLWRARRALSLEGYAGWSLARGLSEPQTSAAIAALEPFAPTQRAYIFGGEAHWRPNAHFAGSAVYQRELRTDRAGLYSERAGADGRLRWLGATLDGQLTYDVAEAQVNEARLHLQLPQLRRTSLALEARHHEPFFELWTIWGAFSPVGFDEVRALASWSSVAGDASVSVGGGPRRYQDTGAGFPGLGLRQDGYRFTADGSWQMTPAWITQAGYSAEIGFGAARSDQTVALRRVLPGDGYAGLTLASFQTASEFRVSEGHVMGVGADAGFALGGPARVDGSLYLFRHVDRAPDSPDWSQARGTLRLTWTLGREPGPRILGPGARPAGRP
jgi:hypothetical protein